MLTLVESYDHSDALVMLGARSYPASCLVEDDDGIRWYVVADPARIDAHTYARATASGAAVLVYPGLTPESTPSTITVEWFMQERTETASGEYRLTAKAWRKWDHWPTYAEVCGVSLTAAPLKGFVHLHTHSEFSSFDGLSKVSEIVEQVVAHGQSAAGLTDHGMCSGHPEHARQCAKAGIKPIFGMEGYFTLDRFTREQVEGRKNYNHLVLLAQTQQGLRNLWGASTEAWRDGFYEKPRMDWHTLEKFSEGVIASSACLGGPLAQAILRDDEDEARALLGKFLTIYGDRFYLELHANSLPEQKKVNEALVAMGRETGVPLLAVVDSHFPTKDDAALHRVWMACSTGSQVEDTDEILGFDHTLYVQSEDDVRDYLSYLDASAVDEAVANTVAIAESCSAEIVGKQATPIYSKQGGHERDADRLLDLCMDKWSKTDGRGYTQDVAMQRFEREFKLLVDKKFCGYFLMVADYVDAAKTGRADPNGRPILVGPGRGSGGGSLVAYLSGITGIDPIEGDLLFERFMTEGRTSLPDFDVDFASSKRTVIQQYVVNKYGEDRVVRVGTHIRYKNKGVIKALGRALDGVKREDGTLVLPETWFMDNKKISEIITEAEASTAGLGLSWEELWAQEEDRLGPFREKYPEVFAYADVLVGRLNSYGKHAAGLVISTDEVLSDTFPLYGGQDGEPMVAQFGMNDLEALGLVKFDFLVLRNLDTIQMAVDLVGEKRGVTLNPDDWREEYDDPFVWEEVSAAHTLGIFQIETVSGTRLTKRFQPKNLSELSDMITLVRPGPMRSGLTDLYIDRRAGLKEVTYPDPRLETVLAKTYGTMLYQEDIMAVCMVLGGYDSVEADEVRKILGKKQVEKVVAEGQRFVARCAERGMAVQDATALWEQIAEFAKYSFNRAHAYAYAVLGYWCAWLKFNYPVEFLTAALSTIDKNEVPDFIKEARRMGYKVLPPDINASGVGFKAGQMQVRYGLDALDGIGVPTAQQIVAHQPYESYEDFYVRCVKAEGSKVNMGHAEKLVRIGAFDTLEPNRRWLEVVVTGAKTKADQRCQFLDRDYVSPWKNPEGQDLPCRFDWSSLPPILGRTGKPLKNQAKALPPKKCTKSCHQYVQVESIDPEAVTPYTDEDIRAIEQDMLKVYLSSTPFERLDDELREMARENARVILSDKTPPDTKVGLVGIITKIRPHKTRNGDPMGFVGIETEEGTVDAAVFPREWEHMKHSMKLHDLGYFEARKGDKGNVVNYYNPI